MLHQPHIMGGLSGQASDIEIAANEMLNTKKRLTEIYAAQTGKDYDTLDKAMDRDFYLSATEAMDWGIVDTVVKVRKGSKS
jgi:ATP-dependent Clp protease protease subunit